MMSVSEADHVKLQLLGIITWDAMDKPNRWVAVYDHGPSGNWVYYKDGKARHPYNLESDDARIMGRTEEDLIRRILENLK